MLGMRKAKPFADEWIKPLEDGRLVKFTNEQLAGDRSFITAQVGGNRVVYSVMLDDETNGLSRQEVETQFEAELSRK